MRLAIVASHPIQYQAPWFRALAHHVELDVLYCHRQDAAGHAAAGFERGFEWDVPLLDGYRYRWLTNVSPRPSVDAYGGCDTPQIGEVLRQGRFDACLVMGWYLKSFVQAIRGCWRLRMPVLARGDSQLATPRSVLVRAAKFLPYRWLLPRIDAHLFVGHANRDYLRHFGVPNNRLHFVPHFVDNDRFSASASLARQDGSAGAIRSTIGASSRDIVFMFAGKFIPKKRPSDFVEALGKLHARGFAVRGAMIGSGPLESELRRQVLESNAPVAFLGFANQTEMPVRYAAADCLVLPSDGGETWGLVVNEAMACGLPAIVSNLAGCAADMITDDVTGFQFPCGSLEDLVQRMENLIVRLSRNPQHFNAGVTARIRRYSCDVAVAGLQVALSSVVSPERLVSSSLAGARQ
ncbi:MAG: glycosyltransferase family 4 protein [Vicinamibacterales bacterium]